jgi:hypothetical protein
MPNHRCLTCRFWLPAFPEADLHRAERALQARRGPEAALAGACARPGCRVVLHRSSRNTCDHWAPAMPLAPVPLATVADRISA